MKRLIGTAILAVLATLWVCAQEPYAPQVSFLTCGPGADIYELEGHTALCFRTGPAAADCEAPDTSRRGAAGQDMAVNWGVFDFNTPNFAYRFASGDTFYRCAATPAEWFVGAYAREGRWVDEQVLALSPAQARRVASLTLENLLPENATYRYNYVLDNCATRPLEILRKACGDSLVLHPEAAEATFRSEMRRFHKDYPWYQFGIDLALGSGIDRPISPLERAFAPVTLQQLLATAQLVNPDGSLRPLVADTIRLVEERQGGGPQGPTPWPLTPMAMAVYLLIATGLVTWHDLRRRTLSRWFDTLLFGLYGVAGMVLTFLIFVSVHEATSPNWLYLWLNPLCLVAAIGIWLKRYNVAVYSYQILNFALLTVLLAGAHYFGQSLNAAFPVLIVCDMARAATYIYLYRCSKTPNDSACARPRSC